MLSRAVVLQLLLWIVLALCDAVLLPSWRIGGVSGSLVVAYLAYSIMMQKEHTQVWQGVVAAGALYDVLSLQHFGVATATLLLTAFVLHQFTMWFVHDASVLLLALVTALGSLSFMLFSAAFNGVLLQLSLVQMLGGALYAAALGLVILGASWLLASYRHRPELIGDAR